MDLQLSEEQAWLSESIDELLARETGEGIWAKLVEFGALERLGAVEAALIARGLGTRLAAVPFIESAAVRYALGRTEAPGIGDAAAAVCLAEPSRSFAPTEPSATVVDGRLSGEKTAVSFGVEVDLFAVSAASAAGLALVLVPAGAGGIAIEPETTLDPTIQPALVRFDCVGAESVVAEGLVETLAGVAGVLAAAEAVGAAAGVLELAREYAAQRRQFGHTIGSFQAVRHLLADLVVKVESSWSSVLYAAASLDEDDPGSFRTASIAKAYASRSTLEVAHGAMQVFGGVAFTAEHPSHLFLRRIVARGHQYGTAGEHRRALGRGLANELEVLT
jgi:alkylation response protein AidB-like acyl-CoA dehydrogenase